MAHQNRGLEGIGSQYKTALIGMRKNFKAFLVTVQQKRCTNKETFPDAAQPADRASLGFVAYGAVLAYDLAHIATTAGTLNEISTRTSLRSYDWLIDIPLGGAIGAIATYFVMDRFRLQPKHIISLLYIPILLGWALIGIFPKFNDNGFVIARCIQGMSGGGFQFFVPIFIAKNSDQEIRGRLISTCYIMLCAGSLLSSGIAALRIPLAYHWGTLSIIILVTLLLLIGGFVFPPEPRADAHPVRREMVQLQRRSGNDEIQADDDAPGNNVQPGADNGSFASIKQRHIFEPFLLVLLVFCIPQISGSLSVARNNFLMWKHNFPELHYTYKNLIISAVQLIFCIICSLTVDKFGRKNLLLVSSICMVLSLILFGVFPIVPKTTNLGQLPFLFLFEFGQRFGYGPIAYILLGEMLPLEFESKAVTCLLVLHALFSLLMTKICAKREGDPSSKYTFYVFALLGAISAIVVLFRLKETNKCDRNRIPELYGRSAVSSGDAIHQNVSDTSPTRGTPGLRRRNSP